MAVTTMAIARWAKFVTTTGPDKLALQAQGFAVRTPFVITENSVKETLVRRIEEGLIAEVVVVEPL